MVRRLSILVLLALTACTASIPRGDEGKDDPDQAAEYRALKHAGSDDPYASLSAARESMRAMARYSTTADVWTESPGRRVVESSSLETAPFGKWRFLGPGNIGGRTRVLLIDPDDPAVMYTGGVSGGIWKSTSAGAKWEPIGDDLANIAVNALAMDPRDHDVLYAGTGEGYFREEVRGTALPLRGDGIFVTRDAGETWTRITPGSSTDFHWVNDLVVSTHDSSRIYAATRSGVWRTTDSGANWTRIHDPSVTGGCLDLAYRGDTAGDYLFASCGTFQRATVYRAKNAETSAPWVPVLSEENMGRTSLAIAPSNPSIVYALAASNEEGDYNQGLLGVYRSSANGDAGSWEPRITNRSTDLLQTLLLSNPLTGSGSICNNVREWIGMGWYCNTIAVDPMDPNRVWAGGVDLFRSDDGGSSFGFASYWWATKDEPAYAHADQHAIVFHPQYDASSNRTVFFTNDGGIARMDDALAELATGPKAPCNPVNSKAAFTSLNNSYGVTQFYHGAVSPDGTHVPGRYAGQRHAHGHDRRRPESLAGGARRRWRLRGHRSGAAAVHVRGIAMGLYGPLDEQRPRMAARGGGPAGRRIPVRGTVHDGPEVRHAPALARRPLDVGDDGPRRELAPREHAVPRADLRGGRASDEQ